MNLRLPIAITLGAALCCLPSLAATPRTPPKLYTFCVGVGVPGLATPSLADQVKLLRTLGYDGVGLSLPLNDELGANLKLLDDAGLQAFMY